MGDVLIALSVCVLSVALIIFILVWAEVREARRIGDFPRWEDDDEGNMSDPPGMV